MSISMDPSQQNAGSTQPRFLEQSPFQGPLQPQYPNYINMQGGPAAAYQQNAMRSGPSQATNMAVKQQGQLALDSQDAARKMASSTAADAKNAVAMKGGLNSGQASQINMQVGNNAVEAAQGVNQANAKNMSQINMQDMQSKDSQLQNSAQMQQSGNAQQNQFNLGRYGTQMKDWAAVNQANATLASGSSGGK